MTSRGQELLLYHLQGKKSVLAAFVDHVSPGRSALVRPPNGAELAGTRVLRLALDEAVAKIRNWGVEDDADDLALPVWAGVVPIHQQAGPRQEESGCDAFSTPAIPAFLQDENRSPS